MHLVVCLSGLDINVAMDMVIVTNFGVICKFTQGRMAFFFFGLDIVHVPVTIGDSSQALGKDRYTLGKGFAECYTRQMALGKQFIGTDPFAECTLSGTRQRLCRVLI